MEELDTKTPTLLAAGRSRKLITTVIVLAILPVVLPVPFYGIAAAWIGPIEQKALQQCTDFICQSATDWNRLGWSLVLGPSLLVALASILLGIIGLIRARWHPTSPENINLLQGSMVSGVICACLLGCVFGVFFYLAGIHD